MVYVFLLINRLSLIHMQGTKGSLFILDLLSFIITGKQDMITGLANKKERPII